MPLLWVSILPLSQILIPVTNSLRTLYIHTLNSSSAQFDHLEWLLNGTVFKTGMVGSMNLQVLIRPVTFVHAGRWECRAVFSDSTTSPSISAGVLTVFGEFHTIQA